MISSIKSGSIFFINAWKNLSYKKAMVWGILSSIYTGAFLLSINYISEKINDPLLGYVFKSVISILIIIPIFLIAYIITDKKSISHFKNNIYSFYIWLLPSLIIACLAGLEMIFFGNIYIFYLLLLLNVIYLVVTMFSPYYLFKHKDLKESMIASIKRIRSEPQILVPVIFNIILTIIIFNLMNTIAYLIAGYNLNAGLILTIFISLFKPLLYSLPLFNLLETIRMVNDKEDKKRDVKVDKIGDII
ncbi:hypothetical protein ACTOJ1_000157 [Shigella flexneri]